MTSFLGGGECQLGGDYFWLCYSGIEKGTRGEKDREIEREKGRAWGKIRRGGNVAMHDGYGLGVTEESSGDSLGKLVEWEMSEDCNTLNVFFFGGLYCQESVENYPR